MYIYTKYIYYICGEKIITPKFKIINCNILVLPRI